MDSQLRAWRDRCSMLGRLGAAGMLVAAALAWAPVAAAADAWPARPLRMVIPFAPGGTTDLLGRMVAEGLTQALGQPVIVENIAGSGGNLGAANVAHAQPDGYTLMMGTPGPLAINQFVYANISYRPDGDFAAVSYVADVPNVILTNPGTGFKTVADLLDAARASPGKLNWGSPGVGSTINSGRLVALGVASDRAVPTLPNVPTVQATVPGYLMPSWFVVVAPANTPKPILDRLSAAIDAYLKQPAVAERLRSLGAIPVGGTPERLAQHLKSEQARYREVIQKTGIKPE